MTEDDVTAERTTLAAVYSDLQARIEDMEATRARVRARLLELGSGPAGALQVRVTRQRRLDPALFAAKYPQAEYAELWEAKPKAAAVKGLGDDTVYQDGTPTLRVTDAD